jgi:HAD superfamily hydrolase (TIGR01456 family)
VKSLALSYGFTQVLTVEEIVNKRPELVPIKRSDLIQPGSSSSHSSFSSFDLSSISGIFVLHDPLHYYEDLQICLDLLTQGNEMPLKQNFQQTPIYFSNPDFLFSGRSNRPRLAAGAFRVSLEALYYKLTGRTLISHLFGKPETLTFKWAENVIQNHAKMLNQELGRSASNSFIRHLYMIGDSPNADIRGANRAARDETSAFGPDGWTSVFVQTGTIPIDPNDPEQQPKVIAKDVEEAVEKIVQNAKQRKFL